jgi:hypothetical protein
MADQPNYSFLFGGALYGTGVGVLSAYPDAASNYRVYFGSNGLEPKITESLSDAIRSAGMELDLANRSATEARGDWDIMHRDFGGIADKMGC